ncbi:FCD domain-containing protein [Rubellimicrobium arenae]|uniref:FCD domain-containing protein n=1 Tax=Rubellimicrobium arenae TaxID=2817372 RepID=UPI001B30FD64|nr:FCD domain-containing protein [Rubellimicrobium arenae]
MTSADQPARTKRADHVQAHLLARIREGELRPGDLLPSERELMTAMSVGRVTIREAMQNLQRMGLVEIRHGGRPRVRQPTLEQVIRDMGETMRHTLTYSGDTFDHFKNARLVFEKEMVRLAALVPRPERIQHLRDLIGAMDAAKVQREQWREGSEAGWPTGIAYDAFLRLDGDFHKAIALMTGNPVLAALCGALFDWLAYFHVDRVRSPGLERLTIEEHSRIVDALEAGDPDLAVGRMAEHLNRANTLYRQDHAAL